MRRIPALRHAGSCIVPCRRFTRRAAGARHESCILRSSRRAGAGHGDRSIVQQARGTAAAACEARSGRQDDEPQRALRVRQRQALQALPRQGRCRRPDPAAPGGARGTPHGFAADAPKPCTGAPSPTTRTISIRCTCWASCSSSACVIARRWTCCGTRPSGPDGPCPTSATTSASCSPSSCHRARMRGRRRCLPRSWPGSARKPQHRRGRRA